VRELDRMVCEKMEFTASIPVSGQTYSRKVDAQVLGVVAGVAATASKFSGDIRMLQAFGEIEEPFEKNQIGSSAMAYKRNPMRSERIGSLARYVEALANSTAFTASTQWFERTLDDSANKRLAVPQAFLAMDAMLILAENVASGLVVYPRIIERHVLAELPFMATENILMAGVKKGGNRQDLHEAIRKHSLDAAKRVKQDGLDNDLLERIAKDPAFGLDDRTLREVMDPAKFTGRSPQITEEFLAFEVEPLLARHPDWKSLDAEDLRV
ncbi:MAG TPA: lyase family protein, partial [Fibrobacteria bacterium]|nr:lyase family protein [Fibrobacteria bacterium]